MVGYVYAFETPSMPGIVKIGATERHPAERLHDANESDTWRPPEAYHIAWAVEVDAPFIVEKQIHDALADVRVNPRREFFRVTPDEARSLAMALAVVARPLAMQTTPVPSEEPSSYEALKARFELRHFKTENDKLPFHSINVRTGEITSRTKDAFKVAYMDWIPVGGKQFLDRWFNDGLKRAYERIEYGYVKKEDRESTVYYAFPDPRHETLVSTSTSEEKQANVDYFLDYVLLLVEDNPAHVEWMVMWLADILVNPHDKGPRPVSVVLWGELRELRELRELMARLLGDRLVASAPAASMRSGAGGHDFDSTLLFIEFEDHDFKTHRGHDSVDERASRALFTTNSPGSAVIESGDRRYAAFAVSKRRVGDAAYWSGPDGHYQKLSDASYIKDVADYLLSHREALGTYVLQDKRPVTDYYKSLKQPSRRPELEFLRDAFLHGAFAQDFLARFVRAAGVYAIPSSMMCGEYNRWRAENGLNEQISSKSFTMKMVSHGASYGIRHDTAGAKHNSFLIDSAKLRAALARDFGPPRT